MYCDEAGFVKRFGQDELDQATMTNGGLDYDSAAEDADAIVDSYLAAIPGRTFPLPLTAPPARIVGVAADLARYELWANRASEEIRNRRDQAVDYLKDLVAGRALLLLDVETVADPAKLSDRLAYASAPRVFTGCSLSGFVADGTCADPRAGLRGCD